jgi:hypothetical protein
VEPPPPPRRVRWEVASTQQEIQESAKQDFWKEGVERSGESTVSSKPAVPETVLFLSPQPGPGVTQPQSSRTHQSLPVPHSLNTMDSPWPPGAPSLGGRQEEGKAT